MYINYKRGFSLTELLIVLVVIAVLFAAMAPIVTKRRSSDALENEAVWNFVSNDDQRDIYFDPGVASWSSSAYFGFDPSNLSNADKQRIPGKVVIRSGKVGGSSARQRQIQFKYGAGDGVDAGSLLLDTTGSLFLGSENPNLTADSRATIVGLNAAGNLNTVYNAIGIGHASLSNSTVVSNNVSDIIAVGANSGRFLGSSGGGDSNLVMNDVFVGTFAGGSTRFPNLNVAIGYDAMGNRNSIGNRNVFIGADAGQGFNTGNPNYNTIIGSRFHGTSASNNVLIGVGAYEKGKPNANNITAIGYGACNSLNGTSTSASKVCIGYNSGAGVNKSVRNADSDFASNDDNEHIYLGGIPEGGFTGRSVLEIHHDLSDDGDANIILNSNLIVRGGFFPNSSTSNDSLGDYVSYNTFSATPSVFDSGYQCDIETYYTGILDKYNGFVCSKSEGFDSSIFTGFDPVSMNAMKYEGNCSAITSYPYGGTGCPNLYTTSDARLKENITPNNDSIEKIFKILPYNYTFKGDIAKTPQVGVIAQDLQNIFPNSVAEDSKGFLRIRWDEMFYSMINAIKNINQKLATIGQRITEIKSSVKVISAKQKDIKKRISNLESRITKLEKK